MKTEWIIVGCGSIAVYMLLFSAGVLIDSAPYRSRLVPAAVQVASIAGAVPAPITTGAAASPF